MYKIRDFRCRNDHVFEALVDDDNTVSRCRCGADAKRVISPVRSVLDPISGHFPSATERWAKEHEAGARSVSER